MQKTIEVIENKIKITTIPVIEPEVTYYDLNTLSNKEKLLKNRIIALQAELTEIESDIEMACQSGAVTTEEWDQAHEVDVPEIEENNN